MYIGLIEPFLFLGGQAVLIRGKRGWWWIASDWIAIGLHYDWIGDWTRVYLCMSVVALVLVLIPPFFFPREL
jgi:hypothetical protein